MSAPAPSTWHIGVIGGSGLSEGIGLDGAQDMEVLSSFGEPSGPVTTGTLEGVRFTFLARHGAGHVLPPASVNYRANIDVLKRCGVTDLLALSAVGSLSDEIAPGQFVAVDQVIDSPTRSARGSANWLQQRPRARGRRSGAAGATWRSTARSSRPAPRASSTGNGAGK
jgi:purine nucleoside phosphorylase